MRPQLCKWLLLLTILLSCNVAKADPTAIVESVSKFVKGLQMMDYLRDGQVIHLGSDDRIVLGYLESCVLEKIVGGEVHIGSLESIVANGTVRRERVECDGGKMISEPGENFSGGGYLLRETRRGAGRRGEDRDARIYSRHPFFHVTGDATEISILRLDRSEPSMIVKLKSRFLDFKDHKTLVPGARYVARAGQFSAYFQVNASATQQTRSILGRLVRLSKSR